MAFNAYVFKKWAALGLCAMLTTTSFAVVTIYYGWLWGIGAYLITMLIAIMCGSLLLNNPFTDMLEGKGLLAVNLDSTGIMRFFIIGVKSPFVTGKIDGKQIQDAFDRNTVMQMGVPVKTPASAYKQEGGKITLELDTGLYNQARFAFAHYPVLIWNNQVKSFLTKDFLADQEKIIFAEHGVLYLNRLMEELTSLVRDFGRYVVELTKPASSIFANKWFWIILIIGGGIMLAIFAPSIIAAIKGTTATATSTATKVVAGTQVVTPIN